MRRKTRDNKQIASPSALIPMQNWETRGPRGRKKCRHARHKRRQERGLVSPPLGGHQAEAERVKKEKDPVQEKAREEPDVHRAAESGPSPAWPLPPRSEHGHASSCVRSNRDAHITPATDFGLERVSITAHLSFDYLDLTEERTLHQDMRTAAEAFVMYATWWAASSARHCYAKGCHRPASMICGRCHTVRFCSHECISADWERTDHSGHRACCKPLRVLWELASAHRARPADTDADSSNVAGDLRQGLEPCSYRTYRQLKRLLRSSRMRGITPRSLLRGYIVSTDAPQDEALAFLFASSYYCWATPPDEVRLRSLHPRTRTLVTALRSLHRCCQAEAIVLVFDGWHDDTPTSSWVPFTISPCPCHDHEGCFRAAAADPSPSAAELLCEYASLW